MREEKCEKNIYWAINNVLEIFSSFKIPFELQYPAGGPQQPVKF